MAADLTEWEAYADQFYRDTGYMRPGKDDARGEHTLHERSIAFSVWLTMRRKIEALVVERRATALAAPATREVDGINNRAQAIYDALHERGFGADNGGRKLALFHAILDGLTCKLDADGERIAPPAAASVEVTALMLEAADRIAAIRYGDCDDVSADDAAFAARLRAAALAAAGRA